MKKISNTLRKGTTSMYLLYHYSQMINKKTFQAYNWKAEENVNRYNISQPPRYSLGHVSMPSVLFWSEYDTIAGEPDVEKLKQELPNLKMVYKVEFSHIDYMWGQTVTDDLYLPICKILNTLA